MEASIPAASVIVPAWNASRWIERTLATVMSQTVRDIEIIVVDDGSTDGTRGIVERLAGSDGRIRIVAQANGGVARARNLGIAHATAPLIAPVDADDLWHPRRLELHLAAFERGGERLGLVYSPYARIDEDDRVLEIPRYLFREGSVFASNVYFNLVGNGSGITIRKPILEALGGYSSFLRDRGAEGCEDRLLQMKVSHGHGFACVPLPLIGYRKSSTSMSARQVQMALSAVLALEDIRRFATDVRPAVFWFPRIRAASNLFSARLMAGETRAALRGLRDDLPFAPLALLYSAAALAVGLVKRGIGRLRGAMKRDRDELPKFGELDLAAGPPQEKKAAQIIGRWLDASVDARRSHVDRGPGSPG